MPAALAALKATVQAQGAGTPKAKGRGSPGGRRGGLRGAKARKGSLSGLAVVVLDEMDQLLAGDPAVLTELFLLPKVRCCWAHFLCTDR